MPKDKISLIIFDLDGTLVDAYAAVEHSLNIALTQMGYPLIDENTVKRSVGWGEKTLVSKFVKSKDVEKTLAIYRRDHQEALKHKTKFLPGAQGLLRKLKSQGYKLAIASNRPTRFTRIILKHLNVLSDFQSIVCADKVKHGKPAPDILKKILKDLHLRAAQALFVGDMTIDIEAGRRAKIKTVAVLTGSSSRNEIISLNPFAIVRSVDQVFKILQRVK